MRILVLQLKRIGDTILTTPLIAALREHLPDASITLAIDASTSALGPALGADQLFIFRRGLTGCKFWREIAAGGFDVCLDLTGNDRSAMAAFLSRASRRITWNRFAKKPFRRRVYTDFVESSVKNRHTVDHHTDLLQALGIRVENASLHLDLPSAAREEARAALARAGVTAPFVVVHAGTARAEKYWLPDRWATVIRSFSLPVVLTGSADTTEQQQLAEILRHLPGPCANLSGSLSLLGTAAVIEQASLLCAVDSAPVHFADALGTPLVALFGPTNPFHWRPRRATSRIVTAATQEITPQFPKAPMSDIQSQAVIEAAAGLLA